ncbi:DNA-binding protein [Sporosarcina koreensis]|uniref:DNA-binding protein n=1 Tax=Sporosarcina koreensis TaxID=334735 RepID=A0ABW0TX73_9BACL
MQIELSLPSFLEEQLRDIVSRAIEDATYKLQLSPSKDWMTLKEATSYAGVSINTFNNFRLHGLKVFELDGGVKRVSKKEIDSFMNTHSY